jgi:hypothetical protein
MMLTSDRSISSTRIRSANRSIPFRFIRDVEWPRLDRAPELGEETVQVLSEYSTGQTPVTSSTQLPKKVTNARTTRS